MQQQYSLLLTGNNTNPTWMEIAPEVIPSNDKPSPPAKVASTTVAQPEDNLISSETALSQHKPTPRNTPSTTPREQPQTNSVDHLDHTLTTVLDATRERSTVEAFHSSPSPQVPTSGSSSVTFAPPLAKSIDDPAITESLLN